MNAALSGQPIRAYYVVRDSKAIPFNLRCPATNLHLVPLSYLAESLSVPMPAAARPINSFPRRNLTKPTDQTDLFDSLLSERILLLDGAMGTQIQALGLDEAGVRGERFAKHHKDLKNFADVLCLTHPEKVTDIHRRYLAAGADIVETNTFGASPIGMEEFELPVELVRDINYAAVACARRACDEFNERTPDQPRFVAGSIGPTTKQMAISTNVEDASYRGVTFDAMVDSYYAQVAALDGSRCRFAAARNGDRHAQPQSVPVRDVEVLRGQREPRSR